MKNDFIKTYVNTLDKSQCDVIISDFKHLESQGYLMEHSNTDKSKINDNRLGYSEALISVLRQEDRLFLLDCIRHKLVEYVEEYQEGIFSPSSSVGMAVEDVLIQRTRPSEGYHVWHCERQNMASSSRVLSWILYLNDIEDGGETEFLYHSKRIKPEAGTLLVFPAGFTHAHRGNPPLIDDKFIVTGWNRYKT
tara:strand:- start:61 stop:639 length:579 start_codon:yes stop_codon:yes gene_type:complete